MPPMQMHVASCIRGCHQCTKGNPKRRASWDADLAIQGSHQSGSFVRHEHALSLSLHALEVRGGRPSSGIMTACVLLLVKIP